MSFHRRLYQIEFLVYSAHKTGTQTISRTLRSNDISCLHCHSLQNHTVNMESGLFAGFLESYYRQNGKKLAIISVFREPLERHISSFFQWHGEGEIVSGKIPDVSSTIICTKTIADLQDVFLQEIQEQTLIGRRESIDEICLELGLEISDLDFDSSKEYGLMEMAHCCIYLFRFDILFGEGRFERIFSQMIGRSITKCDSNLSVGKWYRDTYLEFKNSLRIPPASIANVYESRKALIKLFYSGGYDYMLSKAFHRYA